MIDGSNVFRITVDARLCVFDNCCISPSTFPDRICKLHVLINSSISLIMWYLGRKTMGSNSAVEKGSDNIPTNPTICQMVER